MAPKRKEEQEAKNGMFSGMVVFLVPKGVQPRRLQIWKQKLEQMGASVEERFSLEVGLTHVFALDSHSLLQCIDSHRLSLFPNALLLFRWIEDCLTAGDKLSDQTYRLSVPTDRPEGEDDDTTKMGVDDVTTTSSTTLCNLNDNITGIFSKLIDIYRALGDDRRSFSYYKAVSVIDNLPFKIESVDQVKHLPSIGRSMQEHIQEILSTGKLSKLEHFESDEKVKTITLFGQVWGVGPATASKLYDKGHRTLHDLTNEPSLTNAQTIGLKYFHHIMQRIPRHQVQEMETLLKKAGDQVLQGMTIICGGSFRRGKPTCGDMDVIITHPDGKSHKGFLPKYVNHLKNMNFLREDLVFSTHSEEGTDSGVDTYFGLCTYPGRELRHRIDLKVTPDMVYPRDIFAFGLIAWTGNDVLNRRLRLVAESKGFRLDDTGLYPATHGSPGKRRSKATASLKFNEEKEVFDFLGFPWLQPYERNL